MNLEEMFLQMAAADLVVPTEEEIKQETAPVAKASASDRRLGRASQAAAPKSVGEFVESVGSALGGLSDIPAAAAKGAVQGFAGLPGDIEGIGRLLLQAMGVNVEEDTALPTTEDVKKFLDTNLGKVGTGENPYETVGEFMAPGGYAKAVKGSVRGGKKVVESVKETLATPPRGSVQLAPQETTKSPLGFYSAVEDTVANIQQAKGTGAQFLAQIEKTAGIKPEEIKWTGLDEFLKGKKSVTKAEVQEYLASNRVDVQEVRSTIPRLPGEEMSGDKGAFLPKFASYQMPGGENYREILLTLPAKEATAKREQFLIFDENGNLFRQGMWPPSTRTEIAINANPQWRVERQMVPDQSTAGNFRSSHFDQPNVLAHMRVNDRVVDGKKTLFIEEVQSDWHQAGRKKGYADKDKPWELFDPVSAKVYARFATEAEAKAAKAALPEEQMGFDIGKSDGVPDAPFKTTWHELALKRAIQEASEKGYDRIAFTTGKTQIERYPEALRQVADEISWQQLTKEQTGRDGAKKFVVGKDGSQTLVAIADKDGVIFNSSETGAVGKTIDEVIGKPMGEQILSEASGSIKGQDFTVGGKGMEGFYDQILPKSLEKLGKKFDAKVGKTKMDDVEVWSMDITPKMRESVTKKGQPLFVAAPVAPAAMQEEENK
jgi:hypothetical protein